MHVSMESTHALLFNFEAEIMIGDLKEFAFRRIIVFQNLKNIARQRILDLFESSFFQ